MDGETLFNYPEEGRWTGRFASGEGLRGDFVACECGRATTVQTSSTSTNSNRSCSSERSSPFCVPTLAVRACRLGNGQKAGVTLPVPEPVPALCGFYQ